ncbi:Fn3-like domain-containing protein [Penicillium angulare]|uniref:Fn3-like domain-containing protein n=1 Tax=Penicillium angulare TaxID=116970 RepID=UPI0025407DB3|nr:Fn3-like domain-containing protein [Penicillium angulare]KAJ5272426.1 Fn3-like domain-containing protein [Penicillium angulare]
MASSLLLGVYILAEIGTSWGQGVSKALDEVPWKTNNERVNNLVLALAPEEKVSLVHETSWMGSQDFAGYINAVPRLGIPALQMTDGEAGVNGVLNATAIPSQLNIAASFSRELAYIAAVIGGSEARLLNASVLLAPRVNILRDPFKGSFWQGYSEDPYLNGQLGAQGVRGIQDQGTLANSKQTGPSSTGASSGDTNSQVDLQVLHEVYWAPHQELIDAGVATIMCSYAQVNGIPACQYDELLNLTLRGDYNFSGAVMSDWTATHSTAPSIIAGLDWEMGANTYYSQPLYDQIYVYRNLSETYLDRAVHHILSVYDRFGILDGNGAQGNSTALMLTSESLPIEVVKAGQEASYDIAVRSGVLLKNDGTLPLEERSSIAILGATGLQLTNGAGFAERAFGFQERKVPPIDALKKASKDLRISSAVGVDMHGILVPNSALRTVNGKPGIVRNDSMERTNVDAVINFQGETALPGNTSFTWTGDLIAPTSGYYRLALQRRFPGPGGPINSSDFRIFSHDSFTVDDDTVDGYRIFGDGGTRPWSSPLPTTDFWDETGTDVYLAAGAHNLSISAQSLFGNALEIRFHWVTPEQREKNIQKAVQIASSVDVPIVFAHADSPAQVGMQLIEGFDNLIERVAAVNPKTVVVLHNADPVLMPWLKKVSAVLWMGHPGQEGGAAIADLLLGRHSPQGRLPVTYPLSVNSSMTRNPEYPSRVDGANGTAVFSEGINTSYRWYLSTNTPVLFPFGFGLSYTTFDYSDFEILPTTESTFDVSFTLRNTGSVAGGDVPQLYIGPPSNAARAYPGIQFAVSTLAGFDSIELRPGTLRRVTFPISQKQLSFWNQTDRSWVLSEGIREVWIGTDAQNPVLKGTVEI